MRAHPVRHALLAILLCALAACGARHAPLSYSPARGDYPAPGPADDPWGPYIDEAADRFGVPGQWVRAVMHQESGGHEYLDGQPITSAAGAIGLMQLMPATYGDLQQQYGLGDDPFDPHDNIMAGTAYIRQMYDRYGSPGFLAAYNAGPARVDSYLAGEGGLPNETVNYVAAITPHLGGGAATAGGVRFAGAGPRPAATATVAAAASSGCAHDPDAAYDPEAPCWTPPPAAPPAPAPVETASLAAPAPVSSPSGACAAADADAAFDPDRPCPAPAATPAPVAVAAWTPAPSVIGGLRAPAAAPAEEEAMEAPPPAVAPVPAIRPAAAYARPVRTASWHPAPSRIAAAAPATGGWAVQVGAFGRPEEARFAIEMARDAAPPLEAAREVVMPVGGLGGHAVYRARLAGLGRGAAASACDRLRSHALACLTVPPGA